MDIAGVTDNTVTDSEILPSYHCMVLGLSFPLPSWRCFPKYSSNGSWQKRSFNTNSIPSSSKNLVTSVAEETVSLKPSCVCQERNMRALASWLKFRGLLSLISFHFFPLSFPHLVACGDDKITLLTILGTKLSMLVYARVQGLFCSVSGFTFPMKQNTFAKVSMNLSMLQGRLYFKYRFQDTSGSPTNVGAFD